MGKDISLVVIDEDGHAHVAERDYISSNFAGISEFHVGELYGHKASHAIPLLEAGIANIYAGGFKKGIPDLKNESWSWGVYDAFGKSKLMPNDEFFGVYLYHLDRILSKLVEHPEAYFVWEFSEYEDFTMKDGTKILSGEIP